MLWCARRRVCDTHEDKLTGASPTGWEWLVASTGFAFFLTFCIWAGESELVIHTHQSHWGLGMGMGWMDSHVLARLLWHTSHLPGQHFAFWIIFFLGPQKSELATRDGSMGFPTPDGHMRAGLFFFPLLLSFDLERTFFSERIDDTPTETQHDTPLLPLRAWKPHLLQWERDKFTLDSVSS
ncbi:hypothetical protein CONLIGDRAFT_420985 [Coniochaeta ligniaria NRRL 30616]|uniref:Uncharacterized protein n=1 Tax=Coniochaeta ligniaria NRRL 30616 TaxID=1408157 RepID=A0A1J7J1R5_9PEZI|nr:hypothetical protein CONLIGDRAFT_420985 [Coniochaeta ligniaria NRRL 30616]